MRHTKQAPWAILTLAALSTASLIAQDRRAVDKTHDEATLRESYRRLMDAENQHDLVAVEKLVWNSKDALFVAKAPLGWQGYWGKPDIMQHFHDLYQTPFKIDPDYSNEKIVFITPDVAETYVPVKITAVYGGFPKPAPFIMVLLWVNSPKGWKMATDIPIPVPEQASKPAVTR